MTTEPVEPASAPRLDAGPVEPASAPEPDAPRSRSRTAARWIVRTVVALVVVLVLLVVLLLGTDRGTRLALEVALERYSEAIPGEITVESIDGNLGDELCIRGVQLRARAGQPLLEAEQLCVATTLSTLLERQLSLDAVVLRGATIHLWPDASWADLAPPSEPPPPGTLPGPDLGIHIEGALEIERLAVLRHPEDRGEPEALVDEAALRAELSARGRRVDLTVHHVGAQVEIADLAVTGGAGALRWDSPRVRVERFVVRAEPGDVELVSGTFDTLAGEYDARVRVSTSGPGPGRTLLDAARPIPRMRAELVAAGTLRDARAELRARAPGYGSVHVEVAADFADTPVVRARAALDALAGLGVAPLRLTAQSRHAPDRGVEAQAGVVIEDTRLRARLDGGAKDERAVAATLELPGARLEGSAALGPERQVITGDLRISSAEAVVDQLRRLVPPLVPAELPDMTGSGRLSSRCVHTREWRCAVEAQARRRADSVSLAGALEAGGSTLVIELERLQAELRDAPVVLEHPVRAEISDDRIEVSSLRLDVAGGHLALGGRFDRRGESSAVAVALTLRAIDLRHVGRLLPSVPIRGRLGGSARLEGTLAQPRLDAKFTAERLGWGEHVLGRVELDARYAGRRAQAELGWRRGSIRARVFARAPVRVRLDTPSLERLPSEPVVASVDLERLPLDELGRAVGEPRIDGELAARVRAAGTLREPVIAAVISGRGLAFDGAALGRAELHLVHDQGRVHADARLRERGLGRVTASVDLPLALDLAAGRLAHDRRAEHHLAAGLEGLRLSSLNTWVPEPRLGGRVDMSLAAVNADSLTRVRAGVRGRDLTLDDERIGAAEIEVSGDERSSRLRALVSGPWLRLVELRAEVPLVWPGSLQAPRWRPDRDISADLELRDASLGVAPVVRGIAAGQVGGELHVRGTPRDPRLDAELGVDGLAVRGHPLGHTALRARYRDATAELHVEQRRDGQRLAVEAVLPVGVDLVGGAATWHDDREHRLSVRGAGLDQELLLAAVELPSSLAFRAAVDVELRGAVQDLRGHVRVRASAQSEGELPTPVNLRADVLPGRQRARLTLGSRGPTGLVVEAGLDAVLGDLITGKASLDDVRVHAAASATDLALKEFAPLLPRALFDPEGVMQLRASIEGPLLSPVLAGQVEIERGSITIVPLQQRLTDIEMKASLHDADVELERLVARSGDGQVEVSGALHVARAATRGEATLVTRKLPIVRPGLPLMALDSRFEFDLDATGPVSRLDVVARDGFLDIIKVAGKDSASAIPADDGVVYVDAVGRRQAAKASRGSDREPWIPHDFALTFALADPLRVRAASADMDWNGRVSVEREGETPARASGMFSTRAGFVSLLGNEFDIERGEVWLPEQGDLDPFIDLVATTDTAEALVTMEIGGRVSRPTLTLRSDPSMPESDIFALLITGHADASEADDDDYGKKVASLLAAFQSPALQRQLRKTVGVDRVGIAFGDTVEEPILTVGKRFGRKVYVEAEYHHNAPEDENEAEVRLEYRFAPPHWSIETFFGDAAAGGIGLWWQRRFGAAGSSRPPKTRARDPKAEESPPEESPPEESPPEDPAAESPPGARPRAPRRAQRD